MLLPLIVAFQLQAPLAARADTVRPRHDALHYDVIIDVPDSGTQIDMTVETRWRLTSTEPIRLDLDSVFAVTNAWVGTQPRQWGRPPGRVLIPTGGRAGDTIITRIRYNGSPKDGLIIGRNAYGSRTIFADNWPDRAHHWLASQDMPSDKATAAFHVTVGADYQVIANGVLAGVDSLPGGRRRWNYAIAEPVAVYTMVIGVGKFATVALPPAACVVKCVPGAVITYPEDSAFAIDGPFRRAAEIVDYFSSLFGPFPYERLSQVESSTIFGGMENSTAIFYDEKAYEKKRLREGTVAHETAHQWFGDAVTEDDWHHVWLSEGFATYGSALWAEHVGGVKARDEEMRDDAARVFESPATERPVIDLQATDLMGLLNTNSYPKGAWVLHSLRGLMGDSAFFAGMREYYRHYRDSTVLSSDFARVMSKAAGQDLGWYFTQSLTQPGYPVLDLSWTYDGNRLTIDILQVQKESWGTYRLPGLVLLIDGWPAKVNVAGASTHVVLDHIAEVPRSIVVDPDGWWLLKATVRRGK